jgi:endogenous inhibitor of DNA gyrase (YacG/DUF329 family)
MKYNNAKRYFGGEMDTCPECGGHIEQSGEKGRWRRFCTDRCRIVYHSKKAQEKRNSRERPKQICPNCGIDFQPEWGNGQVRKFCSNSCRLEWWKEYRKAHRQEVPAERKCACCGTLFSSTRWHGGEYCSRDCYLQTMEQTRQKVICEWCGEEFSALISATRKYCSLSCYAAGRHNPKGLKKARRRIPYQSPEEWRELIKKAAREADLKLKRGKCVRLICGFIDMHTGFDGLLGIIRYKLNCNPFDGTLYVFCGFSGTMLKYLEWDGMGFCIGKRQAQSGSYPWPLAGTEASIEITEKEFEFLKAKSITPKGQKPKPKKHKKNTRKPEENSLKKTQ